MARIVVWALAVAAGFAVGCQPAKDVPEELPKSTQPIGGFHSADDVRRGGEGLRRKGRKRDDRRQTRVTGKGKELSRAVLKGTMKIQGTQLPTTRTIAALWPDRYYAMNDLTTQGQPMKVRAWLNRPHLIVMKNDNEEDIPNRAAMEVSLAADATTAALDGTARALADPKTAFVFDLQSVTGAALMTGQPMPIQLVKLSFGTLPLFQLTFDAKTDLLLRAEYVVTEQGVRRHKRWTAAQRHKLGTDRLMLPTKTECWHDDSGVVEDSGMWKSGSSPRVFPTPNSIHRKKIDPHHAGRNCSREFHFPPRSIDGKGAPDVRPVSTVPR